MFWLCTTIHLWCLHSWLFSTVICLLALNGCWFIMHGYMNVHKAFCSFTVWNVTTIFCSFIVCVKMHHHRLVCTKNGNFCIINTILCTMIICYFYFLASSFVFSTCSYPLDVNSCCRTFWVCIVVKCSDSCGGCSCTTDVWACAMVSTFSTLPSTSGPKPFVPVLCIFNLVPHPTEETLHRQYIYTVVTLKLEYCI